MSRVPSMPLRPRLPPNLIMARWHKLIESVRNPYRPELHYMRGPGPKWHAKRRNQAGGAIL
jgi:hypothetical protein